MEITKKKTYMKRSLFFVACILASVMMQAQEKQNDYLPFVDRGKTWIVTRFTPGHDDIDEVEYYIPQDVEEVDGNGGIEKLFD